VLLPKDHVAYARLKGEVVVSGAGDHLQIYDPGEAEEVAAPVSIDKLDPDAVADIYNSTLPEQG
jgi:DNA-binding transcriptional regulator/RsmH inhibitor MraZ